MSSDSRGSNNVAYLKDLAVFCTAYMKHVVEVWERMVDRLRERAMSSHTNAEMFTTLSPRAPPFGRSFRIDHPLVGSSGRYLR